MNRAKLALWMTCVLALAQAGGCIAQAAEIPGSHRAWELVTPAEPVAATIHDLPAVAPDGDSVVFQSIGAIPGSPSGNTLANNLAVRGASGWEDRGLGAPYEVEAGTINALLALEAKAFSQDLRTTIWDAYIRLSPTEPVGMYRQVENGPMVYLTQAGRPKGISADAEDLLVQSANHLLPADEERIEGQSVYEISGTTPSLVNLDNDGHLVSKCGASAAGENSMSQSGDRAFFTSPPPEGGEKCPGEPSEVYVREGRAHTTEISASQCTESDCGPAAPSTFVGATPSGSYAFFLSKQRLTNAATNGRLALYRYDLASGQLRLFAVPDAEASGEIFDEEEIDFHIAPDGSAVYLFSLGKLLAGEGPGTEPSLYVADASGLHFIVETNIGLPLQISANGQFAVLSTAKKLVLADEDDETDVYRWDSATEAFTILSQGSIGGNGPFPATITPPLAESAIAVDVVPTYQAVSADGSRVFFGTEEALVPGDANGKPDVYEWHDGAVSLISSGTGVEGAEFAGLSPSGSDVFFRTTQSLTESDQDGGDADIYDARIGGGFPAATSGTGCDEQTCPFGAQAVGVGALPPPTARTKARPPARLWLRKVGRLSRSGRRHASVWVTVKATVPGELSAQVEWKRGGRWRVVGRGRKGLIRPGVSRLPIRFAPGASGSILRAESVGSRLVLRLAKAKLVKVVKLRAGGSR